VTAIEIRNLEKAFDGRNVVDGFSFSVAAGSFCALLGPSGCGKSTTIRLIAGLEQPDGGQIFIDGDDAAGKSPRERRIAMVFQSYALFPHLTVAENIVFGLRVRGIPRLQRMQRLAEVADLTGLSPYLHRKPAALSGGQRQRVALARAIAGEQPICLMDEPLSNLDAKMRGEMRTEIRSLQQRLGMTMVYVTHDQVEAMTMADQIVLMNDGKVEQVGSPAELYEEPASVFVARFIGAPAMNLIEQPDVILGVRAEHVLLSAAGAAGGGGPARLTGTVDSIEYLGADTIIGIATASGERLQARTPGRPAFSRGAAVDLFWREDDEHRFDRSTGRRLPRSPLPSVRSNPEPMVTYDDLEHADA
jgi:sn-glycerol 3-phosphate transport system ATP-binding protein